jgi:hypothetical protein
MVTLLQKIRENITFTRVSLPSQTSLATTFLIRTHTGIAQRIKETVTRDCKTYLITVYRIRCIEKVGQPHGMKKKVAVVKQYSIIRLRFSLQFTTNLNSTLANAH